MSYNNFRRQLVILVVSIFICETRPHFVTNSLSPASNLPIGLCSKWPTSVSDDGCKCTEDFKGQLVCCNVTSVKELSKCSSSSQTRQLNTVEYGKVRSLVIESSPLHHLELTSNLFMRLGLDLASLERIRIVNTTLHSINICSLQRENIKHFSDQGHESDLIACKNVSNLKILDLRDNQLSHLDEFRLEGIEEIYLSGNRWACFRDTIEAPVIGELRQKSSSFLFKSEIEDEEKKRSSWHVSPMAGWLVQRYGKTVKDASKTFCAKPKSKIWHKNSNASHVNVTLLHLLQFNQTVVEKCPEMCECAIINTNTPLKVRVSCTDANLTALPSILPPNTLILNVSSNKITSLEPIRTNHHYAKLRQLMASDNEIVSMSDLIGSHFVKNRPTTINLQFNKLTMFDLNVLRPIVAEVFAHPQSVRFMFAENPWACECETINEIQSFLFEYKTFLPDVELMKCSNDQYLVALDYSHFCSSSSGIDYMAVLVVIEVLLLVLILSKLGYDIRHYNRTGELPWLARHICLGYSYSGSKTGNLQGHNDWHPNMRHEEDLEDPEDHVEDTKAETALIFLRCFTRSSVVQANSSNSDSGGQRSNGFFSLAFRPRRHTNSTSQSSSRMGNNGNNLNAVRSPLYASPRRKITKISNITSSTCANHVEVDLIERCSSSPRSAKSCCSSEASTNEILPHIHRSKKISMDEAKQFRKEILDPQVEEENRPMIHQSESFTIVSPTSATSATASMEKFRKISRLTTSSGSLSTGVLAL